MDRDNVRSIFGSEATPPSDWNWREIPRSEMFKRVWLSVDAARSEAEEMGNVRYVRYVETVLFPFLEAEEEAARRLES